MTQSTSIYEFHGRVVRLGHRNVNIFLKKMSKLVLIVVAASLCFSCTNLSGTNGDIPAESTDSLLGKNEGANNLLPGLKDYTSDIESKFEKIPGDRKAQLDKLARYIKTKHASGEPSNLVFICTHNSRRSHMSQLWAQTAAYYFGLENVHCYSGETEATAFNPRTVRALREAGFKINQTDSTANPLYLVSYAEGIAPVKGFSKTYNDPVNPRDNFAAIMTCSHADKTCPMVDGATTRVSIPYEDPKVADNTPEEEKRYAERCHQIATEMFFIFSRVKL